MPCDHIVFDLGNVMFDWDPKGVADAAWAPEMWDIPSSYHWQEFDRGTLNHEELIDVLLPKYPRISHFIAAAKDFLKLKKGTFDIFKRCQKKGYGVFILSNIPSFYRDYLVQAHPFLTEFHGAVFSCDVGFIKPEKEIYEHLLSKFSLDAKRCLFLDDREENIVAAKKIGMQGLVFDDPENCLQKLVEMQVL